MIDFKVVLKRLLPGGRPWTLVSPFISALFDGLSVEFGRLKAFYDEFKNESYPETSTKLLPEWTVALGLCFPPGLSDEKKQLELFSRDTSVGGQDFVYLQGQLDRAGFNVTLSELLPGPQSRTGVGRVGLATLGPTPLTAPSIDSGITGGGHVGEARVGFEERNTEQNAFFYAVEGTVSGVEEFIRLKDALAYLVATHLQPIFFITGLENIGRVGLGHVGVARVNNFD